MSNHDDKKEHHPGGHDHGHHHHGHSRSLFGQHDHTHELRHAGKRSLIIAFVLIASYMLVEIIGGMAAGSLALLADAGHMATDAVSIALALLAMHLAEKAATAKRTYGYYRLEILAALVNALTLWVIAIGIIYEAYNRFQHIPEVQGLLMLSIGGVGLLVNLVAAWVLRRSSEHNVNVEGAFQHVMADLISSVAVVISGFLVWAFGWVIADPILSVVISLIIIRGSWRLLAKVVNVLLEGTPEKIDLYELCSKMEEIEGVTGIHDIHVWTISPGNEILTAHVLVDPSYQGEYSQLQQRLRNIAYNDFHIGHVTIQLENSADDCTEDHNVSEHLVPEASPIK